MPSNKPVTVAVTGASGLLGTAIVNRLHDKFALLALGHSVALPGVTPVDFLNDNGIRFVRESAWDALVHCAAFRSPDFCAEHREATHRLNAEVPGLLAELVAQRGARMIHISTDYVFDGTSAPYSEEDTPSPVNYYGETKLEAERRVARQCPGAVILRVPALYGNPPAPIRSALVDDAIAAVLSDPPKPQDTKLVRYPTHTADIADVVAFLLKSDFSGVLQASAMERATRYEWARYLAPLLGADPDRVPPLEFDPDRKAPRPTDAHLACDKLERTGAPMPKGYTFWLPRLLRERGFTLATT